MIDELLSGEPNPALWFIIVCVALLAISSAGIVASGVWAVREASVALRQYADARAERKRLAAAELEARELNDLWDEIEQEYRRVHYRHNVHCHTCGRFARQADGWAPGVGNCRYHGITLRTSEATGAIEIIIEPVHDDLALGYAETGPLEIIQVDDEEILALAAQEGALL